VFERLLPILAGIAAPLVGFALRSSRRNRLRHQIESYTELAAVVEEHDARAARLLRELVGESVDVLVTAERASLRRRLDPNALTALVFLVVPGVVAFAWALTRTEWWKWPIVAVSAVWTLIWLAVGSQQLWAPREGEGA
jgi:hypothetical protein